MTIWTVINALASVLITASGTGFLLLMQQSAEIKKMSLIMREWIYISIIAVTAGGLFNILTLSTPAWSEVILNVGIGLLFTWALFFHRNRWAM